MDSIIVQDPLQYLRMHQGPVEECGGHGVSGQVGFPTRPLVGYLIKIAVWLYREGK